MRRLRLSFTAALLLSAVALTGPAHAQGLVSSDPQLAIPDAGGAPACVDTVTFTQPGQQITAFRVGLAIEHSYQSDLRVLLLPPGVTWPGATYTDADVPAAVAAGAIELVANAGGADDDIGGGSAQPYVYTSLTTACDPVFDPGCTAASVDSAASATGLPGTWVAHDDVGLATVYGQDPADFNGQGGTWTLVVIDSSATDDGTLVSWLLEYDGAAVDPPEILVLRSGPISSGATDDLGQLVAGVPETFTYQVGNTGLGRLHVTAVTTEAASNCLVSVLSPTAFTVAPSDASDLVIEVTPLADGPLSFDLRLDNDDADESPYLIHAVGVADVAPYPVLLVTGATAFESPAQYQIMSEDWALQNLGSGDLVVESIALAGADASAFAVGGTAGLPFTVPAGTSANLSVTYLAPTVSDASALVRIVSNSGGAPGDVQEVLISGRVNEDATPTGVGELSVNGQTTFRVDKAGEFEAANWTVQNTGDGDLVITAMTSVGAHAGSFAVGGLPVPMTLAPGDTANVQVVFAPSATRSYSAGIRFTSNSGGADGAATEVPVTGYVTTPTGDPGCKCSSGSAPGPAALMLLLVLGLLWRRRRAAR